MEIDEIINTINKIKNEINEKHNLKKNYASLYYDISEKYPEFEKNYPTIVKQILDKRCLHFIAMQLSYMDSVRKGELTIEQANEEINKYAENKYLPEKLKKQMEEEKNNKK